MIPNIVLIEDVKKLIYNAPKISRVQIQHVDGTLYTTEDWTAKNFTASQANGVAVLGDNASFVIDKRYTSTADKWSSDTANTVAGIVTTNDSNVASKDYAGEANTQAMLAVDTYAAGYMCANKIFANGKTGYLPSVGEWLEAYMYKTEIKAVMSLIGGESISYGNHWTSTQANNGYAWMINWQTGKLTCTGKLSKTNVRAFQKISQ